MPATPAKRKAPGAVEDDDFTTLDVTPPQGDRRKPFEKGFPVQVVHMTYNDLPTGNFGLKMDLTRRFNKKGDGENAFNNNDAVKAALAVACLARPVK